MRYITLDEQISQMQNLMGISEANKTPCQTPDAKFHIEIDTDKISCTVDLPMDLKLTTEEAKILETNIHNSIELVLAQYFDKK